MIKIHFDKKKDLFPLILILILVLARLIPHPPNFTPIIAVAIMGSFFFRNLYLSFSIIIISMLLADAFIGFHNNMFFVYLSLLVIAYIFFQIRTKIKLQNLFICGFLGSIIFFLISNFGVWFLSDMYEKNLNGLLLCYFFALPFFVNTVLSTIFFTYCAFLAFLVNNFRKTQN